MQRSFPSLMKAAETRDAKSGYIGSSPAANPAQDRKSPVGAARITPFVQKTCKACAKSVYPMDQTSVDGALFHKTCFKCDVCKRTLSPGNYASLNGTFYCKPHFKQSFAAKGNYMFDPNSQNDNRSTSFTPPAKIG